MSVLEIEVPPERRDDVLRELIAYYGVKANAVHHAAERHLDGEIPVAAVLEQRAQLAAAEELVDQLGWELGPGGSPASLAAEPSLLTTITHGALAGAADELTDALQATRDGALDVERLARELRRVADLFELVRSVSAATT
jgi:hypothetical protein